MKKFIIKLMKILRDIIIVFCIFIILLILIFRKMPFYKGLFYKVCKSRFQRLTESYTEKIILEPGVQYNYIQRGKVYKNYRHYNEALTDYLKAYEINHYELSLFDNISNLYLAKDEPQKAYEYINKSFKNKLYPKECYYDLAIIFDYEWKSEKAIKSYSDYMDKNDFQEIKEKYLFSLKRRIIHYLFLKKINLAKKDIKTLSLYFRNEDISEYDEIMSNIDNIDGKIFKEKYKIDVDEAILIDDKLHDDGSWIQ